MNRKLANRILQIFIAIWIFIAMAILIVLLCGDKCLEVNLKYVIQVAIALFCGVWIAIYIFKHPSKTNER